MINPGRRPPAPPALDPFADFECYVTFGVWSGKFLRGSGMLATCNTYKIGKVTTMRFKQNLLMGARKAADDKASFSDISAADKSENQSVPESGRINPENNQSVPDSSPNNAEGIKSVPEMISAELFENSNRVGQERTLTHMPQPPRLMRPGKLEPFKPTVRDRKGKFKPGSSGNPMGPPISFVEYIRLMTGDGQELVEHALECLRGFVRVQWEDEETGAMRERLMPADPRYQAEARSWLAERGYGKTPQTIEIQQVEESARTYGHLEPHELREMLRLEAKMDGRKQLESGLSIPTLGLESQASTEGDDEPRTVDSLAVPSPTP